MGQRRPRMVRERAADVGCRVIDHDPANPRASAPLWWLGAEVVPFLDDLDGPPYELAQALQRAVDAGLPVAAVEIHPTRDITHPADVVVENFAYLARPES